METQFQRILDYWEELWTRPNKKWENKTLPKLVIWLSPGLSLKPSEPYSLKFYLCSVFRPLLIILSCLAVSYCVSAFVMWGDVTERKGLQAIFQNPHTPVHAQAITFLCSLAVFLLVVFPLFTVFLFFAMHFPRYYFWNRRAARIQHEENVCEVAAVISEDKTVWPPPPKHVI